MDFEIAIQGNIYYRFYKYPDPNHVLKHEINLSIDNTLVAKNRDEKLATIGPLYSNYEVAKEASLKAKAKYDEEMADSKKKETDVDNSETLLTLRETELTVATKALASHSTSKSLETAKSLAEDKKKDAEENLKSK